MREWVSGNAGEWVGEKVGEWESGSSGSRFAQNPLLGAVAHVHNLAEDPVISTMKLTTNFRVHIPASHRIFEPNLCLSRFALGFVELVDEDVLIFSAPPRLGDLS